MSIIHFNLSRRPRAPPNSYIWVGDHANYATLFASGVHMSYEQEAVNVNHARDSHIFHSEVQVNVMPTGAARCN